MATDWTTTKDCDRCNEHGPFLPHGGLADPERARDGHATWHGFVAALTTPFTRLLRRL